METSDLDDQQLLLCNGIINKLQYQFLFSWLYDSGSFINHWSIQLSNT